MCKILNHFSSERKGNKFIFSGGTSKTVESIVVKKLINVVVFVLAIMLCGNNLAFASVGGANDGRYINCGKTDQVRYIIVSNGMDVILEGLEGDRSSVKEVTIPKNVTKIGDGAFENCVNLIRVNFEEGSNLLEISQRAFCNCRSLSRNMDTKMMLPGNVKYIGSRAFKGCGAIYILINKNSQNLKIEDESVFDDVKHVD